MQSSVEEVESVVPQVPLPLRPQHQPFVAELEPDPHLAQHKLLVAGLRGLAHVPVVYDARQTVVVPVGQRPRLGVCRVA